MVITIKQILLAAMLQFTNVLMASPKRDRFLANRDRHAEHKVAQLFRGFLQGCEAYESVCERPDSQNEHDLVILWERTLLLVEVKATPLKEPFRDPERGFARVQSAFKADGGIQKAYDQGLRLKRHIQSNRPANLYTKDGSLGRSIDASDYDEVFIICVTADDYGIIGSNLSLLLNKPSEELYPWSVSIPALETLFNGYTDAGLGPKAFLNYLRERSRLHERFLATDELEIAGHFAHYGGFESMGKRGWITFLLDSSDFFDYWYFKRLGADLDEFKAERKPTVIKASKSGAKLLQSQTTKVSKNKPCPCGSGRKFKDCHGAPGRLDQVQ